MWGEWSPKNGSSFNAETWQLSNIAKNVPAAFEFEMHGLSSGAERGLHVNLFPPTNDNRNFTELLVPSLT